jgi:hypothetical protein
METELAFEALAFDSTLTRLIAGEKFIKHGINLMPIYCNIPLLASSPF